MPVEEDRISAECGGGHALSEIWVIFHILQKSKYVIAFTFT